MDEDDYAEAAETDDFFNRQALERGWWTSSQAQHKGERNRKVNGNG
jgi:hypothetical protein